MKKTIDNYFQQARSWSDDVYLEAISSRNRYRFAFLWSFFIISLLVIALIILLPLEKMQLVLVHHADDGTIWVEQPKLKKPMVNHLQIESDIVRYVVNRESYSPSDYDQHYALINLLSNEQVAREYRDMQNLSNPDAPINRFKHRIRRHVHVQNIIYLNNNLKKPLVQVNFTVTDYERVTGHQKKQALLALISWQYRGAPKDPHSQWLNWDGFTVTHYSVQQRTI